MNFTKESQIIFGKVDYSDAEIEAANTLNHGSYAGTPDRQVLAVMNADVSDVAYVIVDVTESYREMGDFYYAQVRDGGKYGGPFAVLELEEDEDGIHWGGAFHQPPTTFEAAKSCAIDAAKMLS